MLACFVLKITQIKCHNNVSAFWAYLLARIVYAMTLGCKAAVTV
jgi:hypothetical protein